MSKVIEMEKREEKRGKLVRVDMEVWEWLLRRKIELERRRRLRGIRGRVTFNDVLKVIIREVEG